MQGISQREQGDEEAKLMSIVGQTRGGAPAQELEGCVDGLIQSPEAKSRLTGDLESIGALFVVG